MDKIITRIHKLKSRPLKAYNYELTKSSNEDGPELPNDLNVEKSNILDASNEQERILKSDGLSLVDAKQVQNSSQINASNNTKALIIENYAEGLCTKTENFEY